MWLTIVTQSQPTLVLVKKKNLGTASMRVGFCDFAYFCQGKSTSTVVCVKGSASLTIEHGHKLSVLFVCPVDFRGLLMKELYWFLCLMGPGNNNEKQRGIEQGPAKSLRNIVEVCTLWRIEQVSSIFKGSDFRYCKQDWSFIFGKVRPNEFLKRMDNLKSPKQYFWWEKGTRPRLRHQWPWSTWLQ